MKIEDIAKMCHDTNRAYCETLGDNSQLPWYAATEWQRQSAIKGVEFKLANPNATPQAQHESWLEEKRATGWTYGPVKDPEKKEHPCFRAYAELPRVQRLKDELFASIVETCRAHLDEPVKTQNLKMPINTTEYLFASWESFRDSALPCGPKPTENGDEFKSFVAGFGCAMKLILIIHDLPADKCKEASQTAAVEVIQFIMEKVWAEKPKSAEAK